MDNEHQTPPPPIVVGSPPPTDPLTKIAGDIASIKAAVWIIAVLVVLSITVPIMLVVFANFFEL